MPKSEEVKLDALSSALEQAALGLKAGDLDLTTAKSVISSSLAVAFDVMSGAGLGVLFGAIGSVATALVPSPLLKALGTGGFGIIGLAADWMISDTGKAKQLADFLTDSMFEGAQQFSEAVNDVISNIANGIDIYTKQFVQIPTSMSFQLQSDGSIGEFDDQYGNGSELNVAVLHSGLNSEYVLTTNETIIIPESWPGYSGPGPKTPPTHEPPPASQPMPEESSAASYQRYGVTEDPFVYANYNDSLFMA